MNRSPIRLVKQMNDLFDLTPSEPIELPEGTATPAAAPSPVSLPAVRAPRRFVRSSPAHQGLEARG
jgi:hypothetical protein